jgi:Fe-S-cluster containining protein
MAETNEFQCQRCAKCCRNLLENKNGFLRGLPLTEKEAQLFPKEIVFPKLGIGSKDVSEIVLYQLDIICCPYVNNQNECKIYQKRPLMCQSFPIVAGSISNRCIVFQYRKPGVQYKEPYTLTKQVEASEKLEKYTQARIQKYRKKGLRIWEYNIATKKWILKEF